MLPGQFVMTFFYWTLALTMAVGANYSPNALPITFQVPLLVILWAFGASFALQGQDVMKEGVR